MRVLFHSALFFFLAASFLNAETIRVRPFGSVKLYHDTPQPDAVVIFISGRGGWTDDFDRIAQEIAKKNALVIGVDFLRYLNFLRNSRTGCLYPASDLESLSKFVQKTLRFPKYRLPLLVGSSDGGSLAYTSLAQAPPNTFGGAITLGMNPRITLRRSFCKGYGLESNHAKVIRLPDTKRLSAQLHDAFFSFNHDLQAAEQKQIDERPASVKDLPLIEVNAKTSSSDNAIAVIITGDGGWASIDRDIGNALAQRGIPVVGFNSLQYFWRRRSPQEAAAALERVVEHYLSVWQKQKAILIGYSFGADVLPFLVNRLPHELQDRIIVAALLGPSRTADFEFHLTDWIPGVTHKNDRVVLPEIKKMRLRKILCLYAENETDSVCKELHGEPFHSLLLSGGHHFGGAYNSLAQLILKQ